MIRIHAIQTGSVQIKVNQIKKKETRLPSLMPILFGQTWSDWLPIYAWVIEHPEGIVVVDTGETAKTAESGYFPPLHPYYSLAVRFDVQPEQEIGPQLQAIGIEPASVSKVIMTHLHTDHAGGLHHFPESEIFVEPNEFAGAQGLAGILNGYLPHRWPDWFSPTPIEFEDRAFGPFEKSLPISADGSIVIVPTPGHTPSHVSVVVQSEGTAFFLAGDTSYTQALMLDGQPDGVGTQATQATLDTIRQFIKAQPTVYLPSHDPEAAARLAAREPISQSS